MELTREMVFEKIKNAYRTLLKNDSHLLTFDANERSITHKLAIYLQDEFPDYNVDCEYNRDRHDSKKLLFLLEVKEIRSDETKGTTVYPDIIIHHRGTKDNFIVIEAKKMTNKFKDYDEKKLRGYISELNYQYAFFIEFPVEKGFSNSDFDEKMLEKFIKEIRAIQPILQPD